MSKQHFHPPDQTNETHSNDGMVSKQRNHAISTTGVTELEMKKRHRRDGNNEPQNDERNNVKGTVTGGRPLTTTTFTNIDKSVTQENSHKKTLAISKSTKTRNRKNLERGLGPLHQTPNAKLDRPIGLESLDMQTTVEARSKGAQLMNAGSG